MIFIDGEVWPPSLHGTGTEDYFNAAWGFPSGAYAGPYHGISLASSVQEHFGLWSLYRFHIETRSGSPSPSGSPAVREVRGSARRGAFGHTLSPVESRRIVRAPRVPAFSDPWPRGWMRCFVRRRDPNHSCQKCKPPPMRACLKLNPLIATARGSLGRIEDMARRLDDLSPLLPVDDGMTDEEREHTWAAWESEWESVPAVDVGVTAAETLAAARAAGEV